MVLQIKRAEKTQKEEDQEQVKDLESTISREEQEPEN